MATPKLRFKNFIDKYKHITLREFCEFCGGGTPSKQISDYWNGNIAWVSSSDLSDDKLFNISITRFITEEAISNSATKICPPNSILIVTRVGVGKIALSNTQLCTSQDFTNIIKVENVDKKYLTFLLHTKLKKLCTQLQGTSIKGITTDEIKSLKLNMPSNPEQEKIADFLSLLDRKIALQEKKIALLKDYKKGLLKHLFKKNNSSDFRIDKLKNLCAITTGKLDANAMKQNGCYRFYTCAKEYYLIDEDAHNFIHKLSYALSKNNFHIVNGYGKGVGEFVLNGVAEYCLATNSKINESLTLIPFPQNSSLGIDLAELYKKKGTIN